ncbi:MAG: cytochrome b [Lysobacteraceae bacterium]|nr:MAG: cytochrome b [Xanthomonadaceae bacterium]
MKRVQALSRYPAVLVAIHWLTLVLVVLAYLSMEFRGVFPRGSEARAWMAFVHVSAGLSVLLLVLARIVVRLRTRMAPISPAPGKALAIAAAAGHAALYLFMLAMPLLGWLIVSAEGKVPSLWGLPVPALIGPDRALAHQLEELHELGALVGYWLIGLHVAAALYHHHVRRDDTLRRMLPGA